MDWKYRFNSDYKRLTMMGLATICWLMVALAGSANAANSACDWTGSGFSTAHENHEIVSIFLRCTAGKIVWNYPRGAIRILLRKPMHLQDNFRACLKVYPTESPDAPPSTPVGQARIYLEAPKRLIGLFGGTDDVANANTAGHPHGDGAVLVKCFRSINEQVALYVEAEETPFEITQTVFKYNLEFINNKHYSIRPSSSTSLSSAQHINHAGSSRDDDGDDDDNEVGAGLDSAKSAIADDNRITLSQGLLGFSDRMADAAAANGTWWSSAAAEWWRRWRGDAADAVDDGRAGRDDDRGAKAMNGRAGTSSMSRGGGRRLAIDEQITGPLGETYEICRPCTDVEMAHAYCSSDIVTRGTMFGIQQQPLLSTNEIYVNRTRVLRNNMHAILDAEDAWRHYQKTKKKYRKPPTKLTKLAARPKSADTTSAADATTATDQLTFHTPLHCTTEHEDGEFVFMGRRRFEEMMVICAPRLQEWAAIVDRLNSSDNAPCILSS